MFAITSDIVWLFIFIYVSKCDRRIQEGIIAKAEKPYVVYFVKAPTSKMGYEYWLCGGALVTSQFILTSAACIKDVDFMYAIAGYNKYVSEDNLELDQCTSKMKKKVIYTCYPQGYQLEYDQVDVWSLIDIGVARVETPYDFTDQSYKTLCSYIPSVIPIGYDAKYQESGTDAVVFGWGHQFEWRKLEDRTNHNQENLNYAPVRIINKKDCIKRYAAYGRMREVIDTYMICTLEGGSLDDYGEALDIPESETRVPLVNGCDNRKSMALNPGEAIEDCEEVYEYDDTRREIKTSNHSNYSSMIKIRNKNNDNKTRAAPNITTVSNGAGLTNTSSLTNRTATIKRTPLINETVSFEKPFISNKTLVFNKTVRDTRRYGICQNDHGGPLVTWVGTHEILIGVASVFKVSETYKCKGPYLYTSTQCNGAFIDCILTKAQFDFRRSDDGTDFNISRRSFCRKSINDKSHPTVERHISWSNHPAGAADHERHLKSEKKYSVLNEQTPVINEDVNESEKPGNLSNNVNPSNQRFPFNDKFTMKVKNGQNERYIVSNKRTINENYDPNNNENSAPNINNKGALNINENGVFRNINENGATNNKYVANYHFATPMVANGKYRPHNILSSNSGFGSYNGPVLHSKPA